MKAILAIFFVLLVSVLLAQDSTRHYSKVRFYPNPAHDYLIVSVTDTLLPAIMEIYTYQGRLAQREVLESGQMQATVKLNLKPGIYIVVFKSK